MINLAAPVNPVLLSAAPLRSPSSVAQSMFWEATDQLWYVCQRYVTEGDQARLLVSRLHADGTLLDSMTLLRAGHGANIGVDRRNDGIYLWTDALVSESLWAQAIARVRYVPEGVADASDPQSVALHHPRTGVYRVSATVDPVARELIFRSQNSNVSSATSVALVDRYDLDAAAEGVFEPLGTVSQVSDRTLQGYASLGGYLYTLYGDSAQANTYITCTDWRSGKVVGDQHITTLSSLSDREPEGLCVYQAAPGDTASATLAFGFADGVPGGRTFYAARFPHPGTPAWVKVPYDTSVYVPNSDNYPPQYRLSGDQVHLHFGISRIDGKPWTNGEVLFRLPVPARPDRTQRLVGVVSGAGVTTDTMAVRFEVTTSGDVIIYDERPLTGWVGGDHSFWRC
ncbi:phage baseplate protein [Streptomyces sp. NPDC001770]